MVKIWPILKKNIIRVEITYKTKWMVGSMQYTLHVFSIGKLSTIAKARLMFRKKKHPILFT